MAAEWVTADRGHIPYLQAFVCVEEKRTWSPSLRKRVDKTPWSQRAQDLVRGIRPGDFSPPDAVIMLFDPEAKTIEAIACIRMEWQESGALHAAIPVMAVHVDRQADGVGKKVLDRIAEMVAEEAMTRPSVPYVKIEADVHPKNKHCMSLISKNGWRHIGPGTDGFLEEWAATVELAEEEGASDGCVA